MRGMEHPNIVRFLGTQHSGNWLYIFMEYVAGGSVRSQLDEFGPFDESLCRRCLQQVRSRRRGAPRTTRGRGCITCGRSGRRSAGRPAGLGPRIGRAL